MYAQSSPLVALLALALALTSSPSSTSRLLFASAKPVPIAAMQQEQAEFRAPVLPASFFGFGASAPASPSAAAPAASLGADGLFARDSFVDLNAEYAAAIAPRPHATNCAHYGPPPPSAAELERRAIIYNPKKAMKSQAAPSSSTSSSASAIGRPVNTDFRNDATSSTVDEVTSTSEPTTEVASTTTSSAAAAATTLGYTSSGQALDGVHNAEQGTWYHTGLGACGWYSAETDYIVAVSQTLFNSFPGATANPNLNPICGKQVKASYGGNEVQVTVVDMCVGCPMWALDFSPSAFEQLASLDVGLLQGMTWEFV